MFANFTVFSLVMKQIEVVEHCVLVGEMVMLLRIVLILLNLLFAIGHEESVKSIVKTANNESENMKDLITKTSERDNLNEAKLDSKSFEENEVKNENRNTNETDKTVEAIDKKCNESVRDNAFVLIIDGKIAVPLIRMGPRFSIKNFLNKLNGPFTGSFNVNNNFYEPHPNYKGEGNYSEQQKTTSKPKTRTTSSIPTIAQEETVEPVLVHLREVHCVLNCTLKSDPPEMSCDLPPASGGDFDDCFYIKDDVDDG